jgi:hypothetical protein
MGEMLSTNHDLPHRDQWARLRFAIIGPLLAAPPEDGDLAQALQALAAKSWRHPFTGLEIRFGFSTLERWLYAAKKARDPVQALRHRSLPELHGARRTGLGRTIPTPPGVDRIASRGQLASDS